MSEPNSEASGAGGVRSVRRALELLALFDEQRRVVTMRELLSATGLPKTTVIRLARTLVNAGLLWDRGDGSYTVGPGLVRWAGLASSVWLVSPWAQSQMRSLADATEETANLYVRSGPYRVCVAQEQGSQSLRRVVTVGDTLTMWGGAASKVLLSDADDVLLREVASTAPEGLERLPQLRREVADAGDRGYAVSHGEREAGVSSVAAPVFDGSGKVTAAISVSGPTARFTDSRVPRFVEVVTATAVELSKGHRGQPLFGTTAP